MFSVALVCLSLCKQHYLKSYEQIATKFCGGVRGDKMNKYLNFDGNLGLLRLVNEQKTPYM